MAKVRVVSAYVDLGLTKRPSASFHELGDRLEVACDGRARIFRKYPLSQCWAAEEFDTSLPAANPRAEDRFVNDTEHVYSNLVQHSPLQWLNMAAALDPEPNVFVWLGYSILKQGAFTGRPLQEKHVADFLDRLEKWDPVDIPLPGITERASVNVHGDNWRFCGSTLIVPRRFIRPLYWAYQFQMREFVRKHRCIPLDLAIWPAVEEHSGLPIRWYKAEYDATQLTAFPG